MVGSLAVTSSSVILSQGCKIAFVLRVTGWSCTCPVAGWNRVRILAVPARTYSCGCVAGRPFSCQLKPGCGTVWNGPASSSHQTEAPAVIPACRPARSAFFRHRIRVADPDHAPFAFAHDHAGVAPGPALLPTPPSLVQHLPDRVGADGRQTIFGLAQGPLQHAQ